MTKPLSDAQLVYASNHNLINSHNGKTCRRVTAKGVCGGRVILTNGRQTCPNLSDYRMEDDIALSRTEPTDA